MHIKWVSCMLCEVYLNKAAETKSNLRQYPICHLLIKGPWESAYPYLSFLICGMGMVGWHQVEDPGDVTSQ